LHSDLRTGWELFRLRRRQREQHHVLPHLRDAGSRSVHFEPVFDISRANVAMRHLAMFVLATSVLALPQASGAQEREPLRDFVTAQYYHGIPRRQAAAYGPEAVPELLEILQDPAEHETWDQVVDMLSIVGDARATPALTDFFENRFEGTVTIDTFQALAQVPRALGAIASRGDQEAEAWLERGLMPETLSENRVRWTIPALDTADRSALLFKLNISGMARVGTTTSLERLRTLERSVGRLDTRTETLRPAISEAIATNELILERGTTILEAPQLEDLLRERMVLPPQ
jgi:hypothetical protein